MRPAIFALRVPKVALKKAVAALQLVATFLSATLANLEGVKNTSALLEEAVTQSPLRYLPRKHEQMSKTAGP